MEPLLAFLKKFENFGANGKELDEGALEFLEGYEDLRVKLKEYMGWDKNPKNRKIVEDLIAAKDVVALGAMLEKRLSFGTAGLRGVMGPGFNAMNDLVIIQTSQGFAKYLGTVFSPEELKSKGIVIGYDARHNSARFAVLAANAFMQEGIMVRLFSKICPTPWVPFAVKVFGSCAGIMVTASHNPKEDNGYKVYWSNSAQIISPHDKKIQSSILENLEPWNNAWTVNAKAVFESGMIVDPRAEVNELYMNAVATKGLGHDPELNKNTKVKFCYTPMHGVGLEFMKTAFKKAGLPPFVEVREQKDPDPEFPTVKFPNPEEGKSALNLAIETATRYDCKIILANDPDADRLAVAEEQRSGEWKIFNGNEIGALLGWWCLKNWIIKNGRRNLKNCVMISSTVSSKILKTMAEAEGFQFYETLTGFKWMANLAVELSAKGMETLFAFEEAIGFMVETTVLDKDGISAGIRLAELAARLYMDGLTLSDQLIRIYQLYGFHTSLNSYYICHDPKTIQCLFDNIRTLSNNKYPESIMNGKYKVQRVRDLTTGFDSGEPDQQAKLPVSKGSQMLTFYFDNGLVITLRTSGTEPKIKYYTELCAPPTELKCEMVRDTLKEMLSAIIAEWILPNKWGLHLPPDSETEEERQVRSA